MQFRLFGAVEVHHDQVTVSIPRGHQRTLLAALLLRSGSAVGVGELCDLIWPSAPPADPGAALHLLVLRLRRRLPAGASARIVTRSPGYLMDLGDDSVDLLDFVRLADQARAAAAGQSWAEAAALAQSGLDLWRGEPLGDVDSAVLRQQHQHRLDGVRLDLLDLHVQAELHLGHHVQLLDHLRQLVRDHPLREAFTAYLMTACYRCGRQGEALAAYRETRDVLVAELGVEPGPQLQDLHRRILAGDPELIASPVPAEPPHEVPRQLPAAIAHFVGRGDEIHTLTELAGRAGRGGAVVISAIGGLGGIGKTALAIEAAHRLAPLFPDGQLYVNLRGFDPSSPPLEVTAVVRGFLEALDVPPARIPADVDQQLALYRSRLAATRTLLVLDNARDADQVRPLLPGAGGCLVLVTSRHRLPSLVALDGATPLPLDALTVPEARDLLARRLGAGRLAEQPDAVADLIDLCAGMPLALNITAAHAALHPDVPLRAWADQLRAARNRLDPMTSGAGHADVRTVLSWSYQALDPAAARLFRLLGLHPGPGVTAWAAASLAQIPIDRAYALVGSLSDANLLSPHGLGRFGFHDLLHAYAMERARSEESAAAQQAAVRRMLDHYLHAARHAGQLLYGNDPGWPVSHLPEPAPGTAIPIPESNQDAVDWFQAECPTMLNVLALAQQHDLWADVWWLAALVGRYLLRAGQWADWAAISQAALDAAVRSGDRAGQAHAYRWLGEIHRSEGVHPPALARLRQALALFEELDERLMVGTTQLDIALTHGEQQENAEAVELSRQALEIFDQIGYLPGQAQAYNSIGWYLALLGDDAAALDACETGLKLSREAGNRHIEASTLDSIGYLLRERGDHADALAHYTESLAIRRTIGQYFLQAHELTEIGETQLRLGDTAAARRSWEEALTILDDLRHRDAAGVRARLQRLPPA